MSIRAVSLDFDGSLFHTYYVQSSEKDVIESNKTFLDDIKKDNKHYSEVILFVGSNRQDVSNDVFLSPSKGSCFPAMERVNTYLGAKLDKLLLADIYGDLTPGTSFDRILDKDYKSDHAEWLFDESKVSILYAQMHKIALDQPSEKIVFDFYDDRGNRERQSEDILEWLQQFYTDYPQLIPENVILRLNHYAGGEVTKTAEIKGSGMIDENFCQTVKDMGFITRDRQKSGGYLFVNKYIKPDDLVNRKASKARDERQTATTDNEQSKGMSSTFMFGLLSAGSGLVGASIIVASIATAVLMSTLWPVGLAAGGALLLGTAGFFAYNAYQSSKDNPDKLQTSPISNVG